jgi:beta-phosphoglucomutase-like phosphatase (HAD superfamily)
MEDRWKAENPGGRVGWMTNIAGVLAACRGLLFGFDGPICDVFAGHPGWRVAEQERQFLADQGIEVPASQLAGPHKILSWAGSALPAEMIRAIDDFLTSAEEKAVSSALPTLNADTALAAVHRHVPTAIVSNYSASSIEKYLVTQGLSGYVDVVVGRPYARPARMKPDPYTLLLAVRELGLQPSDCVLIGDAVTDVDACLAAGVVAVGYARTPKGGSDLANRGAEAVIDGLGVIAAYYDGRI